MSKKLKQITPLRQVRLSTGLSQKEFGIRTGIRFDLLQSLEYNRATLTEENAHKIAWATGAAPGSLDPSVSRCAMSFEDPRQPYSSQTWHKWEQKDKAALERMVSRMAIHLVGWTQLLFLAALRGDKFTPVANFMVKALNECVAEFGLDMPKILARELRGQWQFVSYLYGELRENPVLANAVGFRDHSPRLGEPIPDDTVWKGRVALANTAQWDPSAPMPMSLLDKLHQKFGLHQAGPRFVDRCS